VSELMSQTCASIPHALSYACKVIPKIASMASRRQVGGWTTSSPPVVDVAFSGISSVYTNDSSRPWKRWITWIGIEWKRGISACGRSLLVVRSHFAARSQKIKIALPSLFRINFECTKSERMQQNFLKALRFRYFLPISAALIKKTKSEGFFLIIW